MGLKRYPQSREMGTMRVLDSENTLGSESSQLGTISVGNDHALTKFGQAQSHLSPKSYKRKERRLELS